MSVPGLFADKDAAAAPSRVRVLLPLPLAGAYDYLVPDGVTLAPGDPVRVPLGPRHVDGVVWTGTPDAAVPAGKLKPVTARLDGPPLPRDVLRFVDWMADYTLSAPGQVLAMVLRGRGDGTQPRPRIGWTPTGNEPERMTPARARVLEVLNDGPPRTAAELAEIAGVGAGVVRGLADQGVLAPVDLDAAPPVPAHDAGSGPAHLNPAQEAAADPIRNAVRAPRFEAFLLDGVTGSGKTEVYLEAVAEAIAAGRQALILLPEIALTLALAARIEARFGAAPLQWHSDLPAKERRRVWRAVRGEDGEAPAPIVIGARSALFLPFARLGLIVVDEEHDGAFKQDDGIRYHARDMSVVRAREAGVPVVLASATPSLESHANAERGRYTRLRLESRFGSAGMPAVEVVDMRAAPPGRGQWLSPRLAEAVAQTLACGEQALLFLNRRGYAPLTLCRACGHRMGCPNCSAWLVSHRLGRRLVCHHCGYSAPEPETCPECGAAHKLAPCGPGVERIAEEAAARFPDARVALLSSDHIENAAELNRLLGQIAAHEVDILIGTQLVAKGHHFPGLTLVGVVDADLGLTGGDLRAGERTFQLLDQVAGRAGRADRPGRVILQTYMPEHAVMRALAAGDRDRFVAAEMEARAEAGYPPFGRLASLVLSGPDEAALGVFARELARTAPRDGEVHTLGPAPAPIALLRGRHRVRFLVRARGASSLHAALVRWLAPVRVPSAIRLAVDVDPQSFL